jgi:hypothetical protein
VALDEEAPIADALEGGLDPVDASVGLFAGLHPT